MEIKTPISALLDQKQRDKNIWSVGPQDKVFDAIQLMAQKDIGALPVVENTRLLGMISERDYTRKVILLGHSSRETAVADIMTRDPIVVSPSDSVERCMQLMTENHVRHLPVIDGSFMVGIVSIGDVVNWVISAQHAAIKDLEHFVQGTYPA